MQENVIGASAFAGSVILWEDGTATARCSYGHAICRLYEYETSGISPEGNHLDSRARYTAKAPDGTVYSRRGWENVLGRLFSYECSGLTPGQWKRRYGEAVAQPI